MTKLNRPEFLMTGSLFIFVLFLLKWVWQDLNLHSIGYEPSALTVKLQTREFPRFSVNGSTRIRTENIWILSPLSLPIGVWSRNFLKPSRKLKT